MAITERTVNVSGLHVRYYTAGSEDLRDLVLLHGGFGDAWLHWSEVMTLLSEDYHVIAPDLPGYGQSAPLRKLTFEELVQWTESFLQAVNVEQAAMIGHSFGGLLARIFAAKQPKYVPALVMVNGGVIPSIPAVARMMAAAPGFGPWFYRRLAKSASSKSNIEAALHHKEIVTTEFTQRVAANVGGFSQMMRLLTLSPGFEEKTPLVPTLILWGEEDTISPLKSAQIIKSNIAGAQLNGITECGHMPHLEVPEVFTWQIKNFFNTLNR